MSKASESNVVVIDTLVEAMTSTTVDWRDQKITVDFPADFLTGEVEDRYYSGANTPTVANTQVICEQVRKWNLADKNGQILPIEESTVKRLSVYLLDAIVTAMIQAVNPKNQTSQA